MSEIPHDLALIQEDWNAAFPEISANPALLTQHLPNTSPAQLNEAVLTLANFLGKAHAPRGFKPVFDLAAAVLGNALQNLRTAAQHLRNQSWQHFPSFVQALREALSAVHVMVSFGEKEGARAVVANLGAQLAESLALLDTARRELSTKQEQLDAASHLVAKFEAKAASIEEKEEEIILSEERITELETSAKTSVAGITSSLTTATDQQKRTTKILEENEALATKLSEAQEKLAEIQTKTEKQQQLIEALLPKATDAGVSHAFGTRARGLTITKWIWGGVFFVSVAGLVGLACWLLSSHGQATGEQLWQHVVYRIPLAAPLVWLGWFSAIQYGNSIRLQEDYAFKEATSKAFVGYRDYFENIAHASGEGDATDLVATLAKATIEITSKDPLRVLGKSDHDASPTRGLFSPLTKPRSSSE
jgi:hypothetical protein